MTPPIQEKEYSVAVIGAGQLGSRHIQGLTQIAPACRIFVVDPYKPSLERARVRAAELPSKGNNKTISYHESFESLPRNLDYVVIATTSDTRLNVLEKLLDELSIGALLLEKVLFQRLDEYGIAERLISANQVPTWVNCPRRGWPIYSFVKRFFEDQNISLFQIHGGDWGLGCNSVHFLDLFSFLTGKLPSNISTSGLDNKLIPSKRENFFEFTGTLSGDCDGARFDITSTLNSTARLLILIRSETHTCFLDEPGGQAFMCDTSASDSWVQKDFRAPYLSEQISGIAESILVHGECGLTTLLESAQIHIPMIRALGAHASKTLNIEEGFCPVT